MFEFFLCTSVYIKKALECLWQISTTKNIGNHLKSDNIQQVSESSCSNKWSFIRYVLLIDKLKHIVKSIIFT